MSYIKKIQVSGTTYDVYDNAALHDSSEFDAAGVAQSLVGSHNIDVSAHADIREAINTTKQYIDIRVPAQTSADEGKFLRIVNGISTWATVPNAEGVEF